MPLPSVTDVALAGLKGALAVHWIDSAGTGAPARSSCTLKTCGTPAAPGAGLALAVTRFSGGGAAETVMLKVRVFTAHTAQATLACTV